MADIEPTAPGALSISNLKVTSKGERQLLFIPELSVAEGELVGVRGPSGAGKSTLLYAIAGLAPRTTGQVIWGSTDIAGLPGEIRARFRLANIGMIFQDLLLFEELTAQHNGAIAAMYAPAPMRGALRAVAATQLRRLKLPVEPRPVASFSGGERQRVAVARALSTSPAILLADEPTASLDRAAADTLIADLVGLSRDEGTTLIAVSHDDRLLDRMDRVLTVTEGQITDDSGLSHD